MTRLFLGLLVATAFSAVACGGNPTGSPQTKASSTQTAPSTYTLTVVYKDMTLADDENESVTVTNEAGSIIGTTDIGACGGPLSADFCRYEFDISGLPKASFYQLTIGAHPPVSYSFDELQSDGWQLALSNG